MKKVELIPESFIILSFVLLTLIPCHLVSQVGYSPFLEYLVATTSLDSICRYSRELTGDTMTNIGGQPFLIYSRVHDSPANDKAAEYIMERFQSWGVRSWFQQYSVSGRNVIAVLPGTR